MINILIRIRSFGNEQYMKTLNMLALHRLLGTEDSKGKARIFPHDYLKAWVVLILLIEPMKLLSQSNKQTW